MFKYFFSLLTWTLLNFLVKTLKNYFKLAKLHFNLREIACQRIHMKILDRFSNILQKTWKFGNFHMHIRKTLAWFHENIHLSLISRKFDDKSHFSVKLQLVNFKELFLSFCKFANFAKNPRNLFSHFFWSTALSQIQIQDTGRFVKS